MNEKSEIDDLKTEFKNLKEDIAALTAAVEALNQGKTAEAKNDDETASVVDQIEEDFEKYKEEGESLVHTLDSNIKANPVRSVLVALGVGYVLARIMGRK